MSKRNAELAKIHIASQQLGLDRETYELMLQTASGVSGVRSAAALDAAGRTRVLEHLRSRGFVDRSKGKPHNADSPQMRKVEALLTAGGLPWAYADGMAKRMFSVDRVAFCDPQQLQSIIAALTYHQRRTAKRGASQ